MAATAADAELAASPSGDPSQQPVDCSARYDSEDAFAASESGACTDDHWDTTHDKQPCRSETDVVVQPVPDCEVKQFLILIANKIGRTEKDIAYILQHFVRSNWLETIAHLEGLTDGDWVILGQTHPRQFIRLVRQSLPDARRLIAATATAAGSPSASTAATTPDSRGWSLPRQPTRSSTTDGCAHDDGDGSPTLYDDDCAERFIRAVCRKHRVAPSDIDRTVQCIVNDNWYDSLTALRNLTSHQWDMMDLPARVPTILIRALDPAAAEGGGTVSSIVCAAGTAMGRTPSEMQAIVLTLHESGFSTIDVLGHMTEQQWIGLKLPLRLLEEVRKELDSGGMTGGDETASLVTPRPVSSGLTQSWDMGGRPSFGSPPPSCLAASPDTGPGGGAADPRVVTTREEREARMMTVERLVIKVGKDLGKTDAEILPIVHKLVRENWFDSLRSLRGLKPADWYDLGLPKRLVEHIKKALGDPVTLELNTGRHSLIHSCSAPVSIVQFVHPEPELFPCDVYTAVWKLESEVPTEKLPDTLKSLLRLMETILCNPFDETKRIIRKANPNFQARAACYKSALLVLAAVGYEDADERFLLPVAYIARITQAHAALAQLAQVYRDRLYKASKTSRTGLFSAIRRT